MINRVLHIPSMVFRWIALAIAQQSQNVLTALVQIWANKGRSILTTLGIVIAVASIISVVSFVEGFGSYLTKMLRGYGTQYIIVYPSTPPTMRRAGLGDVTLDFSDIEAVRRECDAIHRISPFLFNAAEARCGKESVEDIAVRGVTEDYQVIRNFFVDAGRFFGPLDVENGAYVCVLGRTLLKHLEADESIVGEHIFINDTRFHVLGLLESKGSFFGNDQDETIMIPYTTAAKMWPDGRDRIPFLAEAIDEQHIGNAEHQVTRVLRQRHNIRAGQPDDFLIRRQDQELKQFEKVRNIASGILAGIVSISLLVGGIGIMNVMLVSVTERTREIGLRKSVGGRRRDILLQFLTEAVVLCTVGGAIGVAFGFVIVRIAGMHPKMVDITVPWWSVALSLGFSAGAGIVFGIIPAFRAAILHPIDALRHE
jgi:putative ABC transport system permease protein